MVTKIGCLKVPELKNWQKLDFSGFYGDFTPVWVQIDVFGTCPNLLGRDGPFQLFRPKNHWITFKTWYKSHKIPILCLKNPTQIAEMHFWERWKVIFMLLLANKWPIKLAGVHFMVIMSDQRINSCFFVTFFFFVRFWFFLSRLVQTRLFLNQTEIQQYECGFSLIFFHWIWFWSQKWSKLLR